MQLQMQFRLVLFHVPNNMRILNASLYDHTIFPWCLFQFKYHTYHPFLSWTSVCLCHTCTRLPTHCSFQFGVLSGISTSEHFLGDSTLWRLSKIIAKNVHIAYQYVVYVYCRCWSSYGIIRASKIIMLLKDLLSGNCTKHD